jgi:phosphatidylglycerophosphate synthase
VARVSGRKTKYGSFLDAATDRYKEALSLFVVCWVTGYWVVGFAAVTGSLLVSYHHARASMEGAPPTATGVDLFERFERVATLVLGLVLTFLPPEFFGSQLWRARIAVFSPHRHSAAVARGACSDLDRAASPPRIHLDERGLRAGVKVRSEVPIALLVPPLCGTAVRDHPLVIAALCLRCRCSPSHADRLRVDGRGSRFPRGLGRWW